jgi:hypothetical protein
VNPASVQRHGSGISSSISLTSTRPLTAPAGEFVRFASAGPTTGTATIVFTD